MTHNAQHGQQGGDLPPELLALVPNLGDLLGSLGGSQQGPPVYMGETRQTDVGSADAFDRRRNRTRSVSNVMSVDEAISAFYAWSDSELEDFQERAFNAGLYGTRDRNRVRFGDPTDAQTYNIWADMVQAAAGFYQHGRKVTPWDAVDLAGRGATEDEGGPERAPLTVRLSNPEDIKRLVSQVATEAIGQGLSQERLDEIVAEWQAKERDYQTQAYNTAETGGTMVDPPSIETFADQKAKEADPVAYDAYKVLDNFSVLLETFGGR